MRHVWQKKRIETMLVDQTVVGDPMFIRSLIHPSMATSLRSCSRCGQEFRTVGRAHICPTCRQPKPREQKAATETLSARERQLANLVYQAKSNKEIANDLHLAEGTIKEYLHTIFRKLGVKNRTELALWIAHHHQENAA
jgi:DNA-binding NarL/FixJ family response regulator